MPNTDAVLTVRGLSAKARAELKRQAAREHTSVNALLLRLIEGRTGGEQRAAKPTVHSDLDHLAGTWSAQEARAFKTATAPFEAIDPTLWK